MNEEQIHSSIRDKYRAVSRSAEGLFEYPIGAAGARALGYEPDVIDSAPSALLASFCGVGNPFLLGELTPGATVLDVGCGAGFDLYVASRSVGASGHVLGVDLSSEMVTVAVENTTRAGLANVAVRRADAREVPCDDGAIDIVLSNGMFNLCPRKREAFAEVFRVLRPGGRLQFADIVLDQDLPNDVVGSLEAWSN